MVLISGESSRSSLFYFFRLIFLLVAGFEAGVVDCVKYLIFFVVFCGTCSRGRVSSRVSLSSRRVCGEEIRDGNGVEVVTVSSLAGVLFIAARIVLN